MSAASNTGIHIERSDAMNGECMTLHPTPNAYVPASFRYSASLAIVAIGRRTCTQLVPEAPIQAHCGPQGCQGQGQGTDGIAVPTFEKLPDSLGYCTSRILYPSTWTLNCYTSPI